VRIAQVEVSHIPDIATGGVDFAEVNLVQTGEHSLNDGMSGEAHQVINLIIKLPDHYHNQRKVTKQTIHVKGRQWLK
jgi:hypothetical protein